LFPYPPSINWREEKKKRKEKKKMPPKTVGKLYSDDASDEYIESRSRRHIRPKSHK
jgi:hypothetical protein